MLMLFILFYFIFLLTRPSLRSLHMVSKTTQESQHGYLFSGTTFDSKNLIGSQGLTGKQKPLED